MGTWGTGLYANDSTSDVRDSYIKFLKEGMENKEAYRKILDEYQEYIGDEEEPLFWYALAETQWKMGRLLPEVKSKAMDWIEKDGGLELWEENIKGKDGWKKTLDKLRDKLLQPMPVEKKIRKEQELNHNLWNIGDVYAYQFHGVEAIEGGFEGKYIIIQKIGEGIEKFWGKEMMIIQVLDKIFENLPTLDSIEGLRILPLDSPERVNIQEEPIVMSAYMFSYKKSEYPKKYLTYLGNRKGPANNMSTKRVFSWGGQEWLYKKNQIWRGIEYETVEEGVYNYTPNTTK
jgi:hypothetical protein